MGGLENRVRQRIYYSKEFRENLIAKVLAPNAPTIVELAKQHNVIPSALYRWVSTMKKRQTSQAPTSTRPQDRTLEFKLNAIFETGPMTQEDVSAYCRTHGLYPSQLEEWKTQILTEISHLTQKTRSEVQKAQMEAQQAQSENKQIKSELRNKTQALAEVTALVVLQKKANLLWGDNEGV
jgi:transposase